MDTKATIFLAHSSLDIREARQVRNLFEDMDHDVLLLKLSQQMPEDYLRALLEREIKARDWLVVLRSANAAQSTWVSFEQTHAKAERKPYFIVDLARCAALPQEERLACLGDQVRTISRDIRVFISYSQRDAALADRLRSDLVSRGYEVWPEADHLTLGADFRDQLTAGIDASIAKGALILLMSPASLASDWVQFEVQYALSRKGKVLPCLAAHVNFPDVPSTLQAVHWTELGSSYEDGLRRIVEALQYRDLTL